jgi:death-on-curing protein
MSFALLSVDLVVLIHEEILSANELQGLAADKSLDGALARIDNRLAFGMVDDIYSLAAAYAAAISQGHCFNDGNERTAFQAMDIVLDLNGVAISWDVDQVGARIIELAQSKIDEQAFASWLRALNLTPG